MTVTSRSKEELARRSKPVEAFLARCLKETPAPDALVTAMEYSLLAGGKRLRPVLCLTCAGLIGGKVDDLLPFAAGIECIHTYSLIHDDLPAMDDDDLRRGKPSNHKQFGEAQAILAGDGLHCEAFGLMLETRVVPERLVAAMRVMARAAGSQGMVGGQVLDMAYTGHQDLDAQALTTMQAMKTGALIEASCQCGIILAGGSAKEEDAARLFGSHLGQAFQIMDDVLDVVGSEQELGKPVGSDEGADKTTWPSLLGPDASKKLAREYVHKACTALEIFDGPDKQVLVELAEYVVARVC
ncbi:MAG: polyprenyl synthetase [Deltaproteobacteria bacterium]|nr:MAG: polyprenyl synthetase [Deltaproteobacteria bacterium]